MRLRFLHIPILFIFSLIILFPHIVTADPLDDWHLRNSGTTSLLNGVTYGNGIFVAVGKDGTIATSPDGASWVLRNSGTICTFDGIAYGNNAFVAVGCSIITSPDGVNWIVRKSATDLSGIAYGNDIFVSVGGENIILNSVDGINWYSSLTSKNYYLKGYIEDLFSLISNFLIKESYALCMLGPGPSLDGVTFGNDTFLVVGAYGSSEPCYPSQDARSLISHDGVNWTSSRITLGHLKAVTYGNGMFVAVGYFGRILTSSNGLNWTDRISGTTTTLRGVAYGEGFFVAVGDNGIILTSPDSINWTVRESWGDLDFKGVTYGNGTFIAVGDQGTILQSDPLTNNQPSNNQPSKPSLVYPANTQTGLGTAVTFKWKKSTDTDGDSITYSLYVCGNQSFTGCNPVQTASVDKKSFSVAGVGGYVAGLFLIGIIISGGISRRRKILLIIAVVLVSGMLFVSCGGGGGNGGNTPAPGNGGGTPAPDNGETPPVAEDEVAYTVSGLNAGTTYYWKVVADDGKGGRTESDIWSFTTQ
jgi:hypothetical protein